MFFQEEKNKHKPTTKKNPNKTKQNNQANNDQKSPTKT